MLEDTRWKEIYSIGDEKIDNQHKYLFTLADRVIDLDNSTSIKSEAKNIILELSSYMREHFSYEESFMEKINYPNTKQHISLHKNFIDDIYVIITKPMNLNEIKFQLKRIINSFINHIINHDTKIQKWYKR